VEVVTPGSPLALARDLDLAPHLQTRHLARVVEVHPTLASTNDRALALARQGAEAGLVVVAIQQTAGRGQRGRRWFSPPGAGLYASFLLRPQLSPRLAPALTLVAGVAAHAALSRRTAALALRWPNDLVVRAPGPHFGKKVAGILVEAAADQQRIEHAVIGIGVNLTAAAYPAAVALEALAAPPPTHAELLADLANHLESAFEEAEDRGLGPAAARWTQAAFGLGQTVEVSDERRFYRGRLLGIAEDGALRVDTGAEVVTVYRGDVQLPGVPKGPTAF
jgi:BirA family biotin operon repressor/biotin-[acetyl-CoA-carboxylase] ligase